MSLAKDLAATKSGNKNDMWAVMVKNRLEKLFIEDRDHENRYGLHASAIIAPENEFCYREQVLSLFFEMNQGEQLPVKLLKIFAQGNAMHEKWYTLFRRAGIDIAIERTLFIPKYDLSFTIDAIIDMLGEETILDIKSQSTFAFKKAKGHPKGEKQVNFYLWAYSLYTGKLHKRGFVLVDSKDDQEVRIVPVTYDKEKVIPYIDRLKNIQLLKKEFIENHKVPKRCHDCTDPDCKRSIKCNMRDACWNVGKGRVKLPKELREASLQNAKR